MMANGYHLGTTVSVIMPSSVMNREHVDWDSIELEEFGAPVG